MSEEERLERGIPPTLLRLSVGIEDVEDLVEDLDRALSLITPKVSEKVLVSARA